MQIPVENIAGLSVGEKDAFPRNVFKLVKERNIQQQCNLKYRIYQIRTFLAMTKKKRKYIYACTVKHN